MAETIVTRATKGGSLTWTEGDANFTALKNFTGTGTATERTIWSKMRDVVSAKDYGAVGDGVTNDYAALTAWVTALKTLNAPMGILPAGVYYIGDNTLTLDVPDYTHLTFAGRITAASTGAAINIGKTTANTYYLTIEGLKVSRSSIDYTGGSIGVQMLNLAWSNISIQAVSNFRVGVIGHGYTYGFVYNTITLGYIHDNRTNVQLLVTDAAGGGYCNECTWIGGSLNHSSGYDVATYAGLNLEVEHDATNTINNHRFIGLSMEDAHASSSNTTAASINGENIWLLWPRLERITSQSTYTIAFTANSTRCGIIGKGFGVDSTNISNLGAQNDIQTTNGRLMSCTTTDTGGALGTGLAVLQLQSTNTSAARVLAGYDPTGVETSKITGGGDVKVAGQVQIGGSPSAGAASTITLGRVTQTTVGAAGGASALPATPTGYLRLFIGTTEYVLPYYARV